MKIYKSLLCAFCLIALFGCEKAQPQACAPTAPAEPQVVIWEEEGVIGLPYGTTVCQDPTLPEGETQVLFRGTIGKAQQLCRLTYINGEITDRQVIWQTVTEDPINQIVAVGTGENVGQERKFPLFGDNIIVTYQGQVLSYSRVDTYSATAYTSGVDGVGNITATGTQARVGAIAVDPKIIPYGTRMYIVSSDGKYIFGQACAEDCGGGIKGKRIDLYFDTLQECTAFGVRKCRVYFLN